MEHLQSLCSRPLTYPDLFDNNGHPIAPYDVTAHSLRLAYRVRRLYRLTSRCASRSHCHQSLPSIPGMQTGKQTRPYWVFYINLHMPSMDEGWTRWVFENSQTRYFWATSGFTGTKSVQDAELKSGKWQQATPKAIIFPDQSPNQILNGYAKGSMPDEYTGGVGKEGVENLKKFVEAGRHARLSKPLVGVCDRAVQPPRSKTSPTASTARRSTSPARSSAPNSTRRTRSPKTCRSNQSHGLKIVRRLSYRQNRPR